eukprot:scaffold194893_cov50-Prasinocladus_malaysianus.AAC.1
MGASNLQHAARVTQWHRSDCSRRVRLYWGLLVVFTSLQMSTLLALEGWLGCCDVFPCATTPETKHIMCAEVPSYLYTAEWVMAFVALGYDCLAKCWRLSFGFKPEVNHWVAAASKQYFEETMKEIDAVQEMVSICGMIAGGFSYVARWTAAVPSQIPYLGKGDVGDLLVFLDDLCVGDRKVTLCHLGGQLEAAINMWNGWWCAQLSAVIIVTPLFTWGAVMREAVAKSRKKRLQRLMQLPRPAALALSLCALSLVHSLRVDRTIPGVTAGEMVFHLFFSAICATYTTAVVIWGGVLSTALRPILRGMRRLLRLLQLRRKVHPIQASPKSDMSQQSHPLRRRTTMIASSAAAVMQVRDA